MCVEVEVLEGEICGLPVAVGSCEENIDRWYWDQTAESCKRFEYSGCDGNENNFVTEVDCIETCGVELTEIDTRTTNQPDTADNDSGY
jgi:Kunitz/Bovine pancreatic trypsin inhibitor domain